MKKKALKIITLGDGRLREKSQPVSEFTDDLQELAAEMFRTLAARKGLGLAAVQVGRLVRLFVTQVGEDAPRVFVNPVITSTSEELVVMEEGCLSVPKIYEDVSRPERVRIQAYTVQGKPFTLEAQGLLARVVQHEIDHLDGIVFIDRLDQGKRSKIDKALRSLSPAARL